MGAPGSITAPRAELQSLPGKVLDAPTAVVASFDKSHKVIEVLRPPVTRDESGSKPVPVTTMAFAGTYTIGFVEPLEVVQSFLSVGGAE